MSEVCQEFEKVAEIPVNHQKDLRNRQAHENIFVRSAGIVSELQKTLM